MNDYRRPPQLGDYLVIFWDGDFTVWASLEEVKQEVKLLPPGRTVSVFRVNGKLWSLSDDLTEEIQEVF
jgi:hypothetical protein